MYDSSQANGNAIHPSIDYEARAKLGDWRQGEPIVPDRMEVRARVAQLQLFRALFQGDYSDVMKPAEVKSNYLEEDPTYMSKLLMNRPPEFKDSNIPLSNRFLNSLLDVLPNVIIDIVRYGTGLILITEGEYGLECQAPQPIYWFPVDDKASVLFTGVGTETLEQLTDYGDGRWDAISYTQEEGNAEIIGSIESSESNKSIIPAVSAIGAETIGRAGSIIPIQRPPTTGDWGRSLYLSIGTISIVINKVYNDIDEILQKGKPVATPVFLDPMRPNEDFEGEDRGILIQEIKTGYDEGQRLKIYLPPKGVQKLEYMYWDGTIREQLSFIAMLEEQLSNLSYVNRNEQIGGAMAESGMALNIRQTRTRADVQQFQAQVARSIRKAILMGMAYSGQSQESILSFNETFKLVWPNIFDDEDLVQSDDGDETDDGNSEEVNV